MKTHKIIILQNAEQGVFMKHKNFVSMAALLILALSAVFLVTACPTGTGPAKDNGSSNQSNVGTQPNGNNSSSGNGSSGNGSTPPVVVPNLEPPLINTEETELTALLGKISLDKAIITAAPETITISNLPSAAGVTTEITSNNIELIEYETPDKLKVKKLPETTTDVKITITLTKNGTSKSMDFIVKVFKSGDTLSEEDYLAALTIPTTVSDDFPLPKQLQHGTPITWSSENPDIIGIEGTPDKKAVVIPDLIEKKVKLTATASGNTKDFEVTVLPVVKTEIIGIYGPNTKQVYEFTQNNITIKKFRENKLSQGTLYSYTLNDANKKITVRPTSVLSPEGKWVTIEEYASLMTDMELTYIKNQLKGIDALLSKPTISIAELKEAFKNFFHEDMSGYTDEEFFNKFLKDDLDMEYNEFTDLSAEEQTEKIKAVLTEVKKGIAMRHGLPENASTEDILAELKKQLQQYAAQQIKELKEPCTYTYSIVKNSEGNLHFETEAVHNPSKPWYENRGHWNYNHESSSPETSWIYSIGAEKTPSGTIGGGLSIKENQGGSYTQKNYSGTITGSGPNYTFNGSLQEDPSKQITATITDNLNGTIRIKVTEGGTAESTLSFRGYSL